MTIPRNQIVNPELTDYYHCMGRCVRGAHLSGVHYETGEDYTYRKQWIINILNQIDNVFGIEVYAYAIMSNHYHLVLRINRSLMEVWSDEEVYLRWQRIYPANAKMFKDSGKHMKLWRERLVSLSWFMKYLNQEIATRANKEDQCTGHFWQGRFKSQALLDEGALLNCMVYVDLNPIRAGVSKTPETSKFTSIQQRIFEFKQEQEYFSKNSKKLKKQKQKKRSQSREHIRKLVALRYFVKNVAVQIQTNIPIATLSISQEEYIKLVDWMGRKLKHKKKGYISESIAPILERLKLSEQNLMQVVYELESCFAYAIGSMSSMKRYFQFRGIRYSKVVR